ncbi:MAG TPA: hypothetical protein VIJ53_02365, partial [Acidobacteriaceae bacterium]
MELRFWLAYCPSLLALLLISGCKQHQSATSPQDATQSVSRPAPVQPTIMKDVEPTSVRPSGPIQFTDVTDQAGIHFRHNSGAFGEKYLPETMGSG